MNRKRDVTILHNFIMNITLTMSSFIFPLITFPYVSRVLLPEGTGRVSFAASVVSYFLLIAQLGIPTYGIRECARVRDDKEELSRTVQEIFFVNIIMCVVAYTLFGITVLIIPKFWEQRKLLIITSSMILFNTLGMEWLYKALEMYSYITWRSIYFKLISVVLMFMLIHSKEDYVIYGAISIFASSASNILNFIYLHKLVDLRVKGQLHMGRHMKPILIFFAMSCATTVYLNLDTVMLGFMKTDTDIGYYNAAVKIKNMLVSIVTSLGAVLLPRVTYYLEKGEEDKFKELSVKALQFVIFIAIPFMVYFIIFARQGILLLSGTNYLNAVLPMQCMMPTLLFIGLTNIMGIQIMVPMGKENGALIAVIAAAVVDLALNIILIPRYAATGAAIGTMVAEIVVYIVLYFEERSIFSDLFHAVRTVKIIVAAGVGVIFSVWTIYLDIGYFLCLLISAVCFAVGYFAALILFREKFLWEIAKIIWQQLHNR